MHGAHLLLDLVHPLGDMLAPEQDERPMTHGARLLCAWRTLASAQSGCS